MNQVAMNETYAGVENLLYDVAHSIARQFNRDLQETISEVMEHYLYAYYHYNPDAGCRFPSWVRFVTYKRALETIRKDCYRNARLQRVVYDLGTVPSRHYWDLKAFKRSLSRDASRVVSMVIQSRARTQSVLRVVRENLTDLGWTEERIHDSFQEITLALQEGQ